MIRKHFFKQIYNLPIRIVGYVLITLVVLFVTREHRNPTEYQINHRLEVTGTISGKYLNTKSDSIPTIIISNEKEKSILELKHEKGNLFSNLQLGDSIVKSRNNDEIIVFRDKIVVYLYLTY